VAADCRYSAVGYAEKINFPHARLPVTMPKTSYCSFCGESSDEVGPMLETTDRADKRNTIRICRGCAEMAIECIDRERERIGKR